MGTGIALLFSAFYEAIRLESTVLHVHDENVLCLTQHCGIALVNGGQGTSVVVPALLQRLLESGLFCRLLVLLDRTRSTGTSRRWQGMKVGYVVQFWGEHIIDWGRNVLLESKSSSDREMLRELFASKEEIKNWYGRAVEGAMSLKNLLWQAIMKIELKTPVLRREIRTSVSFVCLGGIA
ncbi:hypothetical protein BDV93DRAFT_558533 [Ceratobasidium sp. AG-I]|nr:hypothetical protein BDV93DRAFT_558533 [Ceratobasidium sp. AG-I]